MSKVNPKIEEKLLRFYFMSYIQQYGHSIAKLNKKSFSITAVPIPEMWNHETNPKSLHTCSYITNLIQKGYMKLEACGQRATLTSEGYDRGYELHHWVIVQINQYKVSFISAVISAVVGGVIGLLFQA